MPHQDFDALRRELEREHDPFTFALFGETYTTVTSPSIGDTLDLHAAPEYVGDTEEEAVLALCRFIRRMLDKDDQPRWDQALYQLRSEHGPLIMAIGAQLAEVYLNRPTGPPEESSSGRPGTGQSSSPQPASADGGRASTP